MIGCFLAGRFALLACAARCYVVPCRSLMTDPTPPQPPPELLTVAEVAALLRCSEVALRDRVRRGTIPSECVVRDTKPMLFRASVLRSWLKLGDFGVPSASAEVGDGG